MNKRMLLSGWLSALLMLIVWVPSGAQNLIPVRTEVAGYPDWQDVNVAGTGYLQLLVAGASTTTPAIDFTGHSSVKLDYKSRTYGGTNVDENTYFIAVSTDDGASWTEIATRVPVGASLAAETYVDLSAYSGTRVKIRFSVAGTNSSVGVGLDDISITGQGVQLYTLSLMNDGNAYLSDGFPKQVSASSSVTLPVLADCGGWQFAGWDSNSAVTGNPGWSGGAEYAMLPENVTLYAIYKQNDSSGEVWTELSALSTLEAGTYVITNGDYYLPATAVTNGPALKTLIEAGVTVVSGQLSGSVKDDMRWVFSGTQPTMTIASAANSANYLFNKDLSDGVNVGASPVNWTFEEYSTGFAMKDAGFSRFCAVNPDALEWRSYSTRTSSYYKINAGVLELYKLSGTSSMRYTSTPGCTSTPVTEPLYHVSNLQATLSNPLYSTVTLSWTDALGAGAYLVKGGIDGVLDPVDGIAEVNGVMVKNVATGVQTVTFTGLQAATNYTFAVYPYNGSGSAVNYKTDGTIPVVQIVTAERQWVEDFDTGSKISYAAADVALSTGSWNLSEAVIGSAVEDKKYGLKSVRMRTSGVLTMNFDKTNGAGVITVYHANYGSLTGGAWKLQLSYNSGIDWEDAGPAISCGSVLSAARFIVNRTEALRCRVVQTGGDRINIDDISMSEYAVAPAATSWTGALSREWALAGNWTQGIPGSETAVLIESHTHFPEITTPVVLASLVLEPAARLTVKQGATLMISGNLRLKSSADGTATLVNQGTVTVAGSSKVEQFIEVTGSNANWWYLSSPVSGALTGTILTPASGNKLGYYDEETAGYPQLTADNLPLIPAKGYLAQIANSGVYSFEGTLNDGQIGPVQLTRTSGAGSKRGFNLIGNPYPSFIDWNAVTGFGTSQSRSDIRPTIWLRTRTAAGTMVFDTFDGEDGTSLGVRGRVSQYIAPLQAFWTKVAADGSLPTISFTNEMRSHQDQGVVSNRLRTPANRPRLRLEVISETERDETIISTNDIAQDGYDFYDSEKMTANQTEIFSVVDNQELVINKLKSIEAGKKVELGFRPAQAGSFTLKATELIHLSTLKVILIDRMLATETELSEGMIYQFTSDGTADIQRFVIEFRVRETISSSVEIQQEQPQIYRDVNKQIVIDWDALQAGDELQLLGVDGRIIHIQCADGKITHLHKQLSPGVYLLRIPSKDKVLKLQYLP